MDRNRFTLMRLTRGQAAEVLSFRYAPPLDFYNPPPAYPGAIENLIDPKWQFHGVEYDRQLVGYASFGADGQLPGGDYTAPALDIGLGWMFTMWAHIWMKKENLRSFNPAWF